MIEPTLETNGTMINGSGSVTASNPPTAEFDQYASGYDAGMAHPLKRFCGSDATAYMEPKVNWLLKDIHDWQHGGPDNQGLSLLDVGCGSGALLKCLSQRGYTGNMSGCDISAEMLVELQRTWHDSRPPETALIEDGQLPYESQTFDVLVASAVFHHVEPDERPALLSEIHRVLRPGGRFYIFEHNPWNPVTQFVVRTTEIDRNAILLSALEARSRMQRSGFKIESSDFLLFFPPRWRRLSQLEGWISWLPFGAQYVVSGQPIYKH